eukprot:CAMPEP_0177392722 /NCGR_PEP_ID=MMETSP0368-20130122/54549_1 /TAXON_ID=447022 ORGANISM="Scrippsiella hangoei-like, Strain SHHI-4" /NCGR_SAMPLE_ID=MMETSP0368 /ASSEMBLY_ACC=CAM_ASM_000363 /LENGTH=81 /DNA_ID=CAMNT_0018858817 /DNA_START=51 /DNA_END=292 /DNA_ORIENTATION=-
MGTWLAASSTRCWFVTKPAELLLKSKSVTELFGKAWAKTSKASNSKKLLLTSTVARAGHASKTLHTWQQERCKYRPRLTSA